MLANFNKQQLIINYKLLYSRGRTPKHIDPFGYHMVSCTIDAHAMRLHDDVVHKCTVHPPKPSYTLIAPTYSIIYAIYMYNYIYAINIHIQK